MTKRQTVSGWSRIDTAHAGGWVPSAVTGDKRAAATVAASEANEDVPLVTVGGPLKVVAWNFDPHGPNNEKRGSSVRRKRWTTAYVISCILFGQRFGVRWLPCYLCGDVFDAWTMDGEHVRGRLVEGTVRTGVALACHACNARKGDHRSIHPAAWDTIREAAGHVEWHRDSDAAKELWRAHPRRAGGEDMPSTPYPGR